MDRDTAFTSDVSLDEDLSDTSLFEVSSGPLPVKSRHVCRIYSLEILNNTQKWKLLSNK